MHTPRSPSGMKAILGCAGMINFKEQLKDYLRVVYRLDDKTASREGSMLHDLTEYIINGCLKLKDLKPNGFDAEQIHLVEGALRDLDQMKLGHYGEEVTVLNTEVRRAIPGFPGESGTVDIEAIIGTTLYIKDWKFGSWPVDIGTVEDPNAQLGTYAVSSLDYWLMQGAQIDNIEISIGQPKNDEYPKLVLTTNELWAWYHNVLHPGLMASYKPDAPLTPSIENCEWCDVRKRCKARHDHYMKIVEKAMALGERMEQAKGIFSHDVVSIEDMLEVHTIAPIALKALNEISTALYIEAMGGNDVDGYKLVKGRKNRSWKSEIRSAQFLEDYGLDIEDIYVSKMVSPAQAEKTDTSLKKDSGFKALIGIKLSPPRLVEEHKPGTEYTGEASDAFSGFEET